MSDGSEHSSGKGVIPYFFYDVISFIIPGASLIIGGFLIFIGKDWTGAVYSWLESPSQHQESIAALTVLFGIAFLLFLGVASAVGFFLSTLSYQVLDRLIWAKVAKLSFSGLMKFGGWDGSNVKLIGAYSNKFGLELREGVNMDRASAICAYYVWNRSQTLGVMTSRFDAEKILSQSLALVSFLLLTACWIWSYSLSAIIGLSVCMAASLTAFHYHRKKRVYARFQIFLAVAGEDGASDNVLQ